MYKLVTNITQARAYLANHSLAAFDIETAPIAPYRFTEKAALDPHKSQIVGISFSVSEGSGIYIPLAHRKGDNADQSEVLSLLRDFAADTTVTKIAHNLSFESMFFYALGIVIQPPVYDTIAAAQLTLKNEHDFRGLGDSGLKKIVPVFVGGDLPTFRQVTGGRHFDHLDPADPETIRYACSDSDYALRMYHALNWWFAEYIPKHRQIVELVESPTAVYCGLMKYNGIPIDHDLMLEKQSEALSAIAGLKGEITFLAGDVDIGDNAGTAAFKRYLFDEQKLPVFRKTDKGKPAVDEEALILLHEWCEANDHELAPLMAMVIDYRKWGKLESTYITGYLKHINPATGRIHPDLIQLGTVTGRFASCNPNMQNMPRAGKDKLGVRNFIVAPEGKVLLALDFSQIELRVGAFYCRDKKMLETYKNGGDIHAQTTTVIYRIPFEQAADKNAEGFKDRRTIAKNCNFGVFFGLFPNGLYRTLKFDAGLDTTIEQCESIIHNLKAGYPMLERWQNETIRRAAGRHYTETWLGRRRYLPDIISSVWRIRKDNERYSLNTPIQGTAADILKLALGRIIVGLPDRPWLRPLLQIHDELVFELPRHLQLCEALFRYVFRKERR